MSIPLSKHQAKRHPRVPTGKLLDATGWKILDALQQDARLSFHELGRRVGLSAPAAAERVRRLEEAGIIAGYRAIVPPAAVGITISAFVRVTCPSPDRYYQRILALAQKMPQVIEAHHVAGDDSFVLKIGTADLAELEQVIGKLTTLGNTVTSVILSTPLQRTVMEKPRG
jgi:Lrp/AsnC family leucine-responsive transcriptional regulator